MRFGIWFVKQRSARQLLKPLSDDTSGTGARFPQVTTSNAKHPGSKQSVLVANLMG
jgi:hypothetical protein